METTSPEGGWMVIGVTKMKLMGNSTQFEVEVKLDNMTGL